ncbi:putative nodulation protein [Nitrobacter sp. Nb-311A]|uniref:carbamoyltransferase family protein n=1 Tax=unclassified Nitrobacter TaxID=2620411 RepID=UPI000068536F|nr:MULTISPECIES: carbamoyltransferase C-terminal domain-containing protein [unclassified Nitrobacter]EAQ33893.1 putative nodulation protein [Nitrobacter sp. Nb-311A]MCB1393226.1 carbamoyltransferase [Nitrobacter sp.]MCV0387379.1 carbamoyltransferase [Nitrobacter sp.]
MSKQHTYVLGLNTYDHDVSACLLRDGAIAFAIAKERITREKHASGFFKEVIDYCLGAEGIGIGDIDLVVSNCYILPVPEMEERLIYQDMPGFLPAEERLQAKDHPYFRAHSDKVVSISHHLAHAYSAFAACPFDEGAIMIVDGVGSYRSDVTEPYPESDIATSLARESESYYRFSGETLECLKKVWMEPDRGFFSDEFYNMPGLGALYSRASTYVFGDWNKCGELMGLAPYGRRGKIRPTMEIAENHLTVPRWSAEFNQPYIVDGEGSWESSPSMRHWEDLAWQVQDDTEKVLLARANWLREATGARNLCIAGGVALNCVANGRIAREAGFENVWIQPAAGDDGIAIGCAYYGWLERLKQRRGFVMEHAYVGRSYTDAEVDAATQRPIVKVQTAAVKTSNVHAETAKLLADQKVIGWFQGRSEFGPRALGNRSLIADPRKAEMKDILNSRVKHRQPFRPFAPIVLAERMAEVFEGEEDSPFMLIAKAVRPEWRDRIPAVVHVDGTARVQTVRESTNPALYRLLKEFEELTGVPVLINTSFNVKGEPIVETPRDAMRCFLTTGIDHLVLHDTMISKKGLHRIVGPLVDVYTDVGAVVMSNLRRA